MTEKDLTHLDPDGHAHMVDVSHKAVTRRVARARARIELTPAIQTALFAGALPKGEALGTARLAGILAAKDTARLIPLCHPVPLSAVEVKLERSGDDAVEITAEASCSAQTGVEMEAMTAVSVAALTLYDMCKALHRGIRIGPIELCYKAGGKSGVWEREDDDA